VRRSSPWQGVDIRIAPGSTLFASLSKHKHMEVIVSLPDISTPCCPLLVVALRLLPGVAPRYERDRLGQAKYQAARSPNLSADFNGMTITLSELEELFVYDKQGRPRVSPAGASLLLRLFEEGAFASFEERNVKGDLELLAQYAKGLATVIERNYWRGGPRKTRSQPANGASQKRSGQGLAGTPPRAVQITDVPSVLFKSLIHRLV
jgi:hypothetical protein